MGADLNLSVNSFIAFNRSVHALFTVFGFTENALLAGSNPVPALLSVLYAVGLI